MQALVKIHNCEKCGMTCDCRGNFVQGCDGCWDCEQEVKLEEEEEKNEDSKNPHDVVDSWISREWEKYLG